MNYDLCGQVSQFYGRGALVGIVTLREGSLQLYYLVRMRMLRSLTGILGRESWAMVARGTPSSTYSTVIYSTQCP